MVTSLIDAGENSHTPKGPSDTQRDKNIILRDNTYSKQLAVTQAMAPNPLDHSYLLDINLTVHAELADKFYDASKLGGYKNKRLTQLQV